MSLLELLIAAKNTIFQYFSFFCMLNCKYYMLVDTFLKVFWCFFLSGSDLWSFFYIQKIWLLKTAGSILRGKQDMLFLKKKMQSHARKIILKILNPEKCKFRFGLCRAETTVYKYVVLMFPKLIHFIMKYQMGAFPAIHSFCHFVWKTQI